VGGGAGPGHVIQKLPFSPGQRVDSQRVHDLQKSDDLLLIDGMKGDVFDACPTLPINLVSDAEG
jgi:hypothetical protein